MKKTYPPALPSRLLRLLVTALLGGWLAALAPLAHAQTTPRIGLVLGGGGARGAAHVGVLQKLQELQVPVDCVAGTSMGGLVAGAFSSGLSPAGMQVALRQADWRDMFKDAASHADFTPRLKGFSQSYIQGSEAGVKNGSLQFPSAVLSGQKIKFFIDRLIRADMAPQRVESQPLPLALLTTDIVTGQRRVWRSGDLASLMRATMSVPGLMSPVKYEGLSLVDGGLVDNVPIAEVTDLCRPDVVIAVNVGSPLLKADEIDASPLSVTAQMINLLTEQNVTKSLSLLRPGIDIYIQPDLDGITAADFERSDDTIARGYAAATAAQAQLQGLSVSAPVYASWQARMARSTAPQVTLDAIETTGLDAGHAARLTGQLRSKAGAPLDVKALEEDLLHAYGEGRYSNVAYQLVRQDQQNVLRLVATDKPWGPNFLRSGLNFAWGSREDARYNIRLAYQMTQLNRSGGELLFTGQLGADNLLGVNWYQPLEAGRPWFAETSALLGTQSVDLYQAGRAQARFKTEFSEINTGLGLNLGRYGVLKSGLLLRHQNVSTRIGSDSLLPAERAGNTSAWFALADLDRFNSPYFPTEGWRARLMQTQAGDYGKLDGSYSHALGFGAYVLTGRAAFTQANKGQLPLSDAAALGGVNNLSGLAFKQLLGSEMRYLGLRSEKIVSQMPLGLRGDLRIGLSLEGGTMQQRYSETQGSGLVRSASVYLGGETPLGPVYLGLAKASDNAARVFLFIGNP
jgi:NTE family protein